jgi:hypothetical protein
MGDTDEFCKTISEPSVSLFDQPVFVKAWHFGFAMYHIALVIYSERNFGRVCEGETKNQSFEDKSIVEFSHTKRSKL